MSSQIERPIQRVGRFVGGPAGFRSWLIRLGPTYIKLGQHLALRPDLIPQDYCDELMLLFDRVPPFSSAEARAIITADLGAPPEQVFAVFANEPFAAGSLAQTHLAQLADGTRVAVKVQRPNIRRLVERDLGRVKLLARVMEAAGASMVLTPRQIADELSEALLQEIDFRHELSNLTLLHRLAAGSPYERIPRPFPEYSGERVVTMEYLHGVPVSEILGRQARLPSESERLPLPPDGRLDPDAGELDRYQLAANLITATLRQTFRYRFFHADLHPGNLFAMSDGKIGFVDFGLCDSWDGTMRLRLLRFLAAVYSGEVEQMYQALAEILIPGDRTDMSAFRADFFAESRRWTSRMRTSQESRARTGRAAEREERSPIASWMIAIMQLARVHGLRVPPMVVSIYRALLVAETVGSRLDAEADLRSVGRQFFERLQVDEVMHALEPRALQPTIVNSLTLFRDGPGQVSQILSQLAEGTFTINVQASEPPRVARARDRRARLVATAILAVSVAAVLSRPDLPDVAGFPLAWVLSALLVLLYLLILVQWRRMR